MRGVLPVLCTRFCIFLPAVFPLGCNDADMIATTSVFFRGEARTIIVEEPGAVPLDAKPPLLLLLHGINESGAFIRYRTGNNGYFAKNGMLTVYPDGSGFIRHNWSDLEKEISFLDAVIDTVSARYRIDTSRLYIAGFSQGGQIAYRMACRYPDRIAAIALVASSIDSEYVRNGCPMAGEVPLIAINSRADPACPFDSFTYKRKWYNSVEAGVSAWVNKTGGETRPDTVIRHSCATMKRWKNAESSEAVLWITDNGGHAWPGGNGFLLLPHFRPTRCIHANKLIRDFFRAIE